MKRILLSLGIALAFTAGTMAQNVGVGTGTVIEGIFDENIKWQLSSDSILTISGTGELNRDYQFANNYSQRIKTIIIEDGITSIGYCCFEDFQSLENVSFPKTLINIEHSAFARCIKLKELIFPEPLTTIGESAFEECTALTSINIPESVTTIGYDAFYNCSSLSSINIPSSVNNFGDDVFKGCISLPVVDNIRYADTYLVGVVDSLQKTYKIKEGTRFIGSRAFECCTEMTELNILETVECVGYHAVAGCSSLTSISIPASVKFIDYGAFGTGSSEIEDWEDEVDVTYCLPGLRTVLSLNTTPANAPDDGGDEGYDQGIFSPFTYLHAPLYVPEGSYWTYAYAWGWGLFTNIKEVAMDSEDLESRKAYMIADARGCNYKVFDEKKGRLVNVEYTHSLDEESEGSCWTVLKENGESYLYNLGAKKYAKMDAKGALSLSDTPVNLSISSSENGLSINGNACMLVLNKNIEVDATGIDDIRVVEKTKKDEIYSIDGRRMNNTTKGVNIVNGKKVIIK